MTPATFRPIYDPWNIPQEEGGWQCKSCGYILEQKDLLGVYAGILFQVKGYRCPKCKHQHGSGKEYNWKILPIPTIAASHQGARN